MEGRRQPDEDEYCRVGSVKWLEDRGEQDDRGRDGGDGGKEPGKKMVRWVEGESQRIKQ